MGFWLFMFAMNLMVPIMMIACGWMMYRHPPKKINTVLGYRTTMSRKNQDTWNFAHSCCGRLWLRLGGIMVLPSVVCSLITIRGSEDQIGTVGAILVTVQCIILCVSIIPVEVQLRKRFDKNGNARG